MFKRALVLSLLLTAPALAAPSVDAKAGAAARIALPAGGDDYSKLVARAAAHDTSVDFKALRFAWLASIARSHVSGSALAAANQKLAAAAQGNNPTAMRDATIAVLSLDYTDVGAQLSLVLACQALRDQACADQAQFVEQGMVKSIIHDGDGESCDTGWEIAAAREEAFVLAILSDRDPRQSRVATPAGHTCDEMIITRLGQPNSIYFRIDAVLADAAKTRP